MKTGSVLLKELRRMLDEPSPIRWDDTALMQYLNDGIQQVNVVTRASNQRWNVRVLNTASSPLSIYGATYTPSTALALAVGVSTLTLPRDCVEVLHVYPENQTERDAGFNFSPSTLPMPHFDQLTLTTNTGDSYRSYLYTFQGTALKFAPSLGRAMDFEIHYVFAPSEITYDTTIDQVPEWSYLSVKLYAKYLAYQAISHPETFSIYRSWEAELERVQSYAQPRTSQRPVLVQGIWDEDDTYGDWAYN